MKASGEIPDAQTASRRRAARAEHTVPAARRGRLHAVLAGHGRTRGVPVRDDRGQVAVEFATMAPIILVTVILLWQAVLTGYTFVLAGNAADEAAHAGTTAPRHLRDATCEKAGSKYLGSWEDGADINCWADGDMVKVTVDLDVPILFPNAPSLGVTVPAESAAVKES